MGYPAEKPRGSLQRFARFIEVLATDDVKATVKSMRCCPEARRGIPGTGECDAAPHFRDLLESDDPEDWVYGMLHTALIPASLLEDRAGENGYERLPEGAHFAVNLARRRAKTGLVWSEATSVVAGDGVYGLGTYSNGLEVGRRLIKNLVPYEVKLTTTGGYSLSWRPTVRLNPRVAFFATLTPWEAARFYRERDPLRIASSSAISLGSEFKVRNALDADLRATGGYAWDKIRGDAPGRYVEVGAGLVIAHFLRIGVDVPINSLKSSDDVHRRVQLSVGIQDFGGLLYWLARFSN